MKTALASSGDLEKGRNRRIEWEGSGVDWEEEWGGGVKGSERRMKESDDLFIYPDLD